MAPISVRKRLLGFAGSSLVLAFALTLTSGAPVHASECSPEELRLRVCAVDATTDSDQVNLIGSVTVPGSPGGAGESRNHGHVVPDNALDRQDVCADPRGTRCHGTAPRPSKPVAATVAARLASAF